MPYGRNPDHLITVARWLYRRYRPQPKSEWNLLGGNEQGRWLGDAAGILDALAREAERQEEAGERPIHERVAPTDGLANGGCQPPQPAVQTRQEKIGPPGRSPSPVSYIVESSGPVRHVAEPCGIVRLSVMSFPEKP